MLRIGIKNKLLTQVGFHQLLWRKTLTHNLDIACMSYSRMGKAGGSYVFITIRRSMSEWSGINDAPRLIVWPLLNESGEWGLIRCGDPGTLFIGLVFHHLTRYYRGKHALSVGKRACKKSRRNSCIFFRKWKRAFTHSLLASFIHVGLSQWHRDFFYFSPFPFICLSVKI